MNPPIDELELISRAKQADPSALTCIYERYSPGIFRYIYRHVGDVDLAEDLRSDVFVRMLENMDRYEDRGRPLSAWLYRIAHDKTIDTLRRHSRRQYLPLEPWIATYEGPEEQLEIQLDHEELRRNLAYLTESQRQVILLRFIKEYSIEETARQIGRSENAVKALQYRGMQTLARLYEDNAAPSCDTTFAPEALAPSTHSRTQPATALMS